jgi:SAM-dependent methyltransferase
MNVNPTDKVLHLSFDDEAYGRADAFCGNFNKRAVANKLYKPLTVEATVLPFKDKEFDFAMCTNVLAYVVSPEKILAEIKRVCKKAHIKEHSVFAETIFGWEQTKWVVDVENLELIIKAKNPQVCGRFGPLFHALYANDPNFHESCRQNPGLLNVSVDWYDSDPEVSGKTSFRPCQTDYLDDGRLVIGKISDKIDVRHLKDSLKT